MFDNAQPFLHILLLSRNFIEEPHHLHEGCSVTFFTGYTFNLRFCSCQKFSESIQRFSHLQKKTAFISNSGVKTLRVFSFQNYCKRNHRYVFVYLITQVFSKRPHPFACISDQNLNSNVFSTLVQRYVQKQTCLIGWKLICIQPTTLISGNDAISSLAVLYIPISSSNSVRPGTI